jgi:L-fuculose-phosphate aldolase
VRAPRYRIEEELVRTSARLHELGWVANHDGNVTHRLEDGRYLATPTALSKGDVARDALIVVDDEGKVVSGSRKPFSELELHLLVYRYRPDVRAVIHSHAPAATALAVAGVAVEPRLLAEPVVSLGAVVPLVPYARPKSPASTTSLLPFVNEVDAVTLESHGVLSWGPDLETAYLRHELVEHVAKIQLEAMKLGRLRTIPEADVAALLEARTKAGLGPAGRAAVASRARAG